MEKIVEVEWFDAQQSNQMMLIEDIQKYEPIFTKTVGYILLEKEEFVILGHGLMFDGFGHQVYSHIIITFTKRWSYNILLNV